MMSTSIHECRPEPVYLNTLTSTTTDRGGTAHYRIYDTPEKFEATMAAIMATMDTVA